MPNDISKKSAYYMNAPRTYRIVCTVQEHSVPILVQHIFPNIEIQTSFTVLPADDGLKTGQLEGPVIKKRPAVKPGRYSAFLHHGRAASEEDTLIPFTKSYVTPHLKRMEQTVQQESPQINGSSPLQACSINSCNPHYPLSQPITCLPPRKVFYRLNDMTSCDFFLLTKHRIRYHEKNHNRNRLPTGQPL